MLVAEGRTKHMHISGYAQQPAKLNSWGFLVRELDRENWRR